MKRTLLFLMAMVLTCVGAWAQTPDYSVYETGVGTRTDRLVKNITLTGSESAAQKLFSSDKTYSDDKLYYDTNETNTFQVFAGETLTPSFSWNGSWMHSYIYIDKENDGFIAAVDENYLPLNDLVAYSAYSKDKSTYYNSKGNTVTANSNVTACPTFTAPTIPGTYRIRFKVDWNSIDPKGNPNSGNTLVGNGGMIADAVIVVKKSSVISDASQLSNDKVYTIKCKDTARGFMYSPEDKTVLDFAGSTNASWGAQYRNVSYDPNSRLQQFAFVKHNDKYYLYSIAKGKFVSDSGELNALGDEASDNIIFEYDATNACFSMKFNSTSQYITDAPGWCGGKGTCFITVKNSELDNGDRFIITEVGDMEYADKATIFDKILGMSPTEFETSMNLAAGYWEISSKGTVGYPIAEQTIFNNLRTAWSTIMSKGFEEGTFDFNFVDCQALINAFRAYEASTDVLMPQDGKAYVIRNVHDGGNVYMLSSSYTNAYLPAVDSNVDPANDVANIFICRKTDTGYVFVNGKHGQYMLFHGKNTTNPFETDGFSDAYSDRNNLILHSQASKRVGTLSIAGLRNRTDDYGGYATMTIASNGNMNANAGQNTATYNTEYSSLFTFQEVAYPNNVKLTTFAGSELISNFGNGTTIGTFSAPFPTVIPSGVTAYFANSNEGEYIKLIPFTGAVPANQGVILVGESTTNAFMIPATTETASVDFVNATSEYSNIFANTAGTTHTTVAGDYVLANGAQGIGFYETNAGGTLAMNKAYLSLGGQSVSAFRLVVDESGETTAIETVETENANAPIYDLSGRRILTTVKGGIYIQNGKKFIVK